MNPGDTGANAAQSNALLGALNEGRGVNPGDTFGPLGAIHSTARRSTKAGA